MNVCMLPGCLEMCMSCSVLCAITLFGFVCLVLCCVPLHICAFVCLILCCVPLHYLCLCVLFCVVCHYITWLCVSCSVLCSITLFVPLCVLFCVVCHYIIWLCVSYSVLCAITLLGSVCLVLCCVPLHYLCFCVSYSCCVPLHYLCFCVSYSVWCTITLFVPLCVLFCVVFHYIICNYLWSQETYWNVILGLYFLKLNCGSNFSNILCIHLRRKKNVINIHEVEVYTYMFDAVVSTVTVAFVAMIMCMSCMTPCLNGKSLVCNINHNNFFKGSFIWQPG